MGFDPKTQSFVLTDKTKFDLFPKEMELLAAEVPQHPPLVKRLLEQPDKDIYIQLSEIASYVSIVLEGEYTRDDMVKLCGILFEQLLQMRTGLVLASGN